MNNYHFKNEYIMNTEEKAKAYDEALEKARQLCAYPTTKPFISDLQDLFPELKEIEGERIRKKIIATIHLYYGEPLEDEAKEMIFWLEKQGEQKPADKVEPKFKVGDWIVFNGLTLYIKEVVKGYYRTISKGGITNSYDWDIDNVARLWTIQDAKDGDIIVKVSGIILFKGIGNHKYEDVIDYYCALNKNNIFEIQKDNNFRGYISESINPATKEQRDLLFQKMYEAGYEWDVEKKELRKIKQPIKEYNITGIGSKNAQGKLGEMIMNLKSVNEVLEQKPKQVWSEEDEEHVNSLLKRLKGLCRKEFTTTRFAISEDEDWLKSLKDRYTWKPSDEYMKTNE